MVRCRPILGLFSVSGAYLNTLHILGMERPAYNNFPKNRNGPGYGGQNQEFRDASRRIFCKLRGQRYLNPSNEWLAKFIQEKLFTFDYEETAAWYAETARKLSPSTGDLALLGCNDRYFLLTVLLGRQDAEHPWLFDRYGRLYRPVGALPLQVEHHHLRWRYPGGDVRSRDHGRYLLGHPADRGQVSAPDQGRIRAKPYAQARLSGRAVRQSANLGQRWPTFKLERRWRHYGQAQDQPEGGHDRGARPDRRPAHIAPLPPARLRRRRDPGLPQPI